MSLRTALGLALAVALHGAVLLLPSRSPEPPRMHEALSMDVVSRRPASAPADAPVQSQIAAPSRASRSPARMAPAPPAPPGTAPPAPIATPPAEAAGAGPAAAPSSLHCPAWAPCAAQKTAAAAPEQAAPADLRALMLARIAAARHYPELARSRGIEGQVVLRFSVSQSGAVTGLVVVRPGHPWLDEAARQAVLRAAPLPVVPGPQSVTIEFRLHGG